ncbi:MAG: hypothetical protein FWG06_00220 [Clostridiales bacterium]|nr:hypothetical protein [Clostridiales bacterium]
MKLTAALLILCLITGFIAGCSQIVAPEAEFEADAALSPQADIAAEEPALAVAKAAPVTEIYGTDVVRIKDKLFMAQCEDIMANPEKYRDKTIILEGMYADYINYNGRFIQNVYRKTPGCCGDDGGPYGFEFMYDGERPEPNDWIEVVGTIEMVDFTYGQYVALRLSKLTVMDERGQELVVD